MINALFTASPSVLRKALALGLTIGLLFVAIQIVWAGSLAGPAGYAAPPTWQDWKTWNFDNASDLQVWQRTDKSTSDGGVYLWAEESYTFTTGTQAVWPLANVLTATSAVTYPKQLDTWLIYSVTVPVNAIEGRLLFDWWLDVASGDSLSVLTSTNATTYVSAWSRTEKLKTWHSDETLSLRFRRGQPFYLAFRFQSNNDDQTGLGAFVDHVRLQTRSGYSVYLPMVLLNWPPIPLTPVLLSIDNSDYDGNYTLAWQSAQWAETYILEEADDASFASPRPFAANANLSQAVANQPGGTHHQIYYYRVKGSNSKPGGGDGAWSNIVSTTVYAVPVAPVMNAISNPNQLSTYMVSWGPDAAADSYELEEASTVNFTDTHRAYTGAATASTLSGRQPGAHAYRVRSVNRRASSAWSNVVTTTVISIHDDFDDPTTGWALRRTSSPDISTASTWYQDGKLFTHLNDRYDFAIFSPILEAPPPPYSIRMATRLVHDGNLTGYGLVFGSVPGTTCPPIDRSTSGDPNGCFYKYYRLSVLWGGYLKFQVKRIDYHYGPDHVERGEGAGEGLIADGYDEIDEWTSDVGWNTWEIKVYNDGFAVYVNDHLLGWTTDNRYVNNAYYGMYISNNEYNGARFEHEYLYIDPLPPTSTLPIDGYQVPGSDWYQPAESAR